MAFFKRKEEDKSQLPELPGLPEMPELPQLPNSNVPKTDIKPLPTFPKTPAGESQGLGMIKSTLMENQQYDSAKTGIPERRTMELSDMGYQQRTMPNLGQTSMSREKGPVFVKLEKFQEAVRKFEEVKIKVKEIENSLNKIRELKDREENELKSWEQEIQMIKDKVSSVDSSLFDKI